MSPTLAPSAHRAIRRRPAHGPWLVLALLLSLTSAATVQALETLYLIRHSEKEEPWPAEVGTYQPLTEVGRQRAQLWAEQLRAKHLAAVYSSPYARTVQTAVAVSTALKIPLVIDAATIETEQIGDFVDRLRSQYAAQHAVLIVGHSNTLPMFLRHFGADAGCEAALTLHRSGEHELIEGYEGLFQIDLTQSGCAAIERHVVPLPEAEEAAHEPRSVVLDAAQLAAASHHYRVIYGFESMGTAEIGLAPSDDGLEVIFNTSIGRAGIQQQATVRLDASGANHRSVSVHGPMGPSDADIELRFEDGKAVGHADFPRSRQKPQGKLEIDRPLPPGTFERNGLFALLPAMPIDRVSAFSLYLYDSREDLLQPIDLRVSGPKADGSRFGSVEAYRVEITGTEPGYVVWIHPETPRHVLAIDWVGQPWTYEILPGKP